MKSKILTIGSIIIALVVILVVIKFTLVTKDKNNVNENYDNKNTTGGNLKVTLEEVDTSKLTNEQKLLYDGISFTDVTMDEDQNTYIHFNFKNNLDVQAYFRSVQKLINGEVYDDVFAVESVIGAEANETQTDGVLKFNRKLCDGDEIIILGMWYNQSKPICKASFKLHISNK